MTNKRLVWYLDKEKKIYERQFGFRKQRNTIDAISKITTKILDEFSRKEKTTAIFFDIKKTYGKVNREKILQQRENMEIQGRRIEVMRELIGER